MVKKKTDETTKRLKKAIEQQEKESRVTPNSSTLDEIHKALCTLFEEKHHADWKLHGPAQSSRLAAMRRLTFDVYSLRDRILDLTQTEFDEKFSSLRNALRKVEDQLKMQSIHFTPPGNVNKVKNIFRQAVASPFYIGSSFPFWLYLDRARLPQVTPVGVIALKSMENTLWSSLIENCGRSK